MPIETIGRDSVHYSELHQAIKCNMNVGAFFKGNVTGIVLILVALVAHETKPWLQLEEDWFQSER